MNENDILDALGEAGEPFAESAAPNTAANRTVSWRRVLPAAAALILFAIVLTITVINLMISKDNVQY